MPLARSRHVDKEVTVLKPLFSSDNEGKKLKINKFKAKYSR